MRRRPLLLAVNGPDDVTVTGQQVNNLPYASLYARLNNGPRIFVVLGNHEKGQLNWVLLTRDGGQMLGS